MKTTAVNIIGKYEINGRVLFLPLSGKGEAFLNFSDVITQGIAQMEKYENKGKLYIKIKQMQCKIEPKFANLYFSNPIMNVKTMDDAVNIMINNNWKVIYEAYRQLPEQAFGEVLREFSNRVLQNYSYDEWFPV